MTAWYNSHTKADKIALQHVVKIAQDIVGTELPSLEHHLFKFLPSGSCYRTIHTRSNRLKNSFFPKAVALLNSDISVVWTRLIRSITGHEQYLSTVQCFKTDMLPSLGMCNIYLLTCHFKPLIMCNTLSFNIPIHHHSYLYTTPVLYFCCWFSCTSLAVFLL